MRDHFTAARLLALLVPVALLGGALGSQYFGGLYPCEMCWWQRYPHMVAIPLALLAFVVPGAAAKRGFVVLAALAVAVSGMIGVYHAGVEYRWWEGMTACTSTMSGHGGSVDDILARIMKAPAIRCDEAQWRLFGISLAGFNAIFSLAGAAVVFALLWRGGRAAR